MQLLLSAKEGFCAFFHAPQIAEIHLKETNVCVRLTAFDLLDCGLDPGQGARGNVDFCAVAGEFNCRC